MTTPEKLLKAAVDIRKNCYAPYSSYFVGAAVETSCGSIYSSVNFENASYGVTSCAEAGAIQAAVADGKIADIVRIAVVGGHGRDSHSHNDQLVTPCGRCRQVLIEVANAGQRDIEVWCATPDLKKIHRFTAKELLPSDFGSDNLK